MISAKNKVYCPECGEEVWDVATGSKLNKCWNAEGHVDGETLAFDSMEDEHPQISCDGFRGCVQPVSHISAAGWLYCLRHAKSMNHSRNRKLLKSEIAALEGGNGVAYVRPKRSPVAKISR